MILTFLLLLLFSNGLTIRLNTSFLYSRIGLIIVFYSILSAYTTFHITCLETGLGLYGGWFYATSITHSFQIFILMISGIILIMTGFYPIKKSVGDPVSFMVILFKKVKQYVNTFNFVIAANLQILYVTCEYIIKCPDDLFFSLETLFFIFIFLLNAFIFTFFCEKMEHNIDRGRAFINLVFDHLPFVIFMIASLCAISYFGRADVFCFFKHTINMSFYGRLLANYLVFLLPCAITIQFISSMYFEDKHFNYDITHDLFVVLGKAIIGIKIENFILYTMIVLFVSVFKAPMWFFLLFCTIGIFLIVIIGQKYEITKTIPLKSTTCWPLLCVAISGTELNPNTIISSQDLPDYVNLDYIKNIHSGPNDHTQFPTKDDLIQQGYTFKDNDYTAICKDSKDKNYTLLPDESYFMNRFLSLYFTRYVKSTNKVDYCVLLNDSKLSLDYGKKLCLSNYIKVVQSNHNEESHVKGLYFHILGSCLFPLLNIVPESHTAGGKFIDFYVKRWGGDTPLCCVEVKAHYGDSWYELVAQGRMYAEDVCNSSNSPSVFVLCARGTLLSYFIYQKNFSSQHNFNQTIWNHKDMIGITIDNKGYIRPLPQLDGLYGQVHVLDLTNENQLKIAYAIGKYIFNRSQVPTVEMFYEDLAGGKFDTGWRICPDNNFVSVEHIEIAKGNVIERNDKFWQEIWNLNKGKLEKKEIEYKYGINESTWQDHIQASKT